MSANTGHQKEQGRFLSLSASANDLIKDEKRSQEDIASILSALQRFKDGTPFVCLPLQPQQGRQRTPEELHQLLSTPIAELPLAEEARVYCLDRGAFYLGEVYLLRFDRVSNPREILERFLLRIDLPLAGNPLEWGWVPPYWSHPGFRALLSIPLDRAYPSREKAYGPKLWFENNWRLELYYIGQVLHYIQTEGISLLVTAQKRFGIEFRRAQLSLIPHACMYVPTDWQAPDEIPHFVTEWQVAKERERETGRRSMSEPTTYRARMAVEADRKSLNLPFEELDLSVLAKKALAPLKCATAGDLATRTESELLHLPGFTRRSLQEVRGILNFMGLELGMRLPENWHQQES